MSNALKCVMSCRNKVDHSLMFCERSWTVNSRLLSTLLRSTGPVAIKFYLIYTIHANNTELPKVVGVIPADFFFEVQ